MQHALAAYKFVKKEGGKDYFPFLLQDICSLLLQKGPRLKQNPSVLAIYNIARLTGRNHWHAKRETLEELKVMKSKTKRCRVCLAKKRFTRGRKHI